ncbi:hypothetical protein AOQ84DRAFT_288939 [Glonium stellatum]|uniref:C2H2-type domain-containing protein n=1 Tax=Glonium stellatum TaxID=574774 RepID=A0A8E2F4U5_9PEZI|nr:hypothetical protein AOQ84DRAFT_288939 [Glonium stellatum]
MQEPTTARPTSQHRLSMSSAASSIPSKSRTHSHSLSVGSINPAHRVTRRKSMSSTTANNVAAMAVAKGVSGSALEAGNSSNRRTSKASLGPRGQNLSNYPSMPSSLPNNGSVFAPSSYSAHLAKTGDAVTDGPPLASMPESEKGNSKARIRRASEGSRLSKGDSKRSSGSELRCEKCGKGYKHSSCLTKHLWEHTPEWQYTSKLLISKHQQVQLLEAASVLVAMNQEGESAKDSDHSSASPAASGSSDLRDDDLSSTDTTPPPQADDAVGSYSTSRSHFGRSKRFSTNSSAYSQSYQSTSVFSDNGQGYSSHYRQWSNDGRPTTSGTSVAGSYYEDEDQADLAAAVGLLSCSYGTPKSGPVILPPDVPPVPPLPARFLGQNTDSISGSTTTPTAHQSSIRGHSYSPYTQESKDVDMDNDSLADDDDFDHNHHHHHHHHHHAASRDRIDEDDDGVFGTMEE